MASNELRTQENGMGNSQFGPSEHLTRLTLYLKLPPYKAQWLLYVPPVQHSTILRSPNTVYLCALCGYENKQRLFPCTALTDWPV